MPEIRIHQSNNLLAQVSDYLPERVAPKEVSSTNVAIILHTSQSEKRQVNIEESESFDVHIDEDNEESVSGHKSQTPHYGVDPAVRSF